ncbi:pirin family protein, partial [Corallococcus carmarthensis]|nr:pirin family protein [Corallococcus carmarthensis]
MSLPEPVRVLRTIRGMPTSDGAGVRLTRVIGGPTLPDLDPFLLLDEFGTDRAED